MRYGKGALTFEDQADQLLDRGLTADRDELIRRLQAVSYYRLSGYLYPFRESGSDRFQDGTTLTEVWERYCFDRRLRVLALDAIERIEVSIRTKLVYHFAHEHGAFGYLDDRSIPKLKIREYLEWRVALQEETSRSKEAFKSHFFEKYGDEHASLPIWMLAELMSMGSTLTFFRGVSPDMKRKIAAEYDLPDEVLLSWLRTLNSVRNLCAHHARLWNQTLGYAALLPKPRKFPEWEFEPKLRNDRSGTILLMCCYLLRKITPTSNWCGRVEALFAEYPNIPTELMGLPRDWTSTPLWVGTVS